uniref:two-partner secretion domain-containing protein n=1 Tax=uncultured Azonexus sp. TaxID=520307 RepID=UPI002636F145
MRRASLNHAYRLIWNELTQSWVAVAEIVRGRGKRSGGSALLAATLLATPVHALEIGALPTGGQISAGAGSISQSGNSMTIAQGSQNLAINWNSFNIGKDASVNFNQPNSNAIALNRVLGTDGTQILGNLNANGQVWILNPNGVLFGKTAQVNVGGLVASSLGMSDDDFLTGKRGFTGRGGSVINQGNITANYAALLGEQVRNEGVIIATLGTVALAAGNKVTLDFDGDNILGVQVDEGALHALVENNNLVQADGGLVVMTAKAKDALLDTAINNTGVVRARSIGNRNGKILLLGDMDSGTVNVGGALDASAPDSGDGGFIETSAAHVGIADESIITTKSASGKNGLWLIDPVDFTIAASGGDMTGTALSSALASSNVTIQSVSGGSGTAGDVNVNDTVSWSANTLTLNAQNNININAQMNGSGTAGLTLEYGQANVAAGNASTYNINAPVNLASTGSFSTKLGSDGTVKNYTIITSLGAEGSSTGTDLQGMQGDLAGNYVLGADIDASATSGWNSGAGFQSIGGAEDTYSNSNYYNGQFDGLGHVISGLSINRPSQHYIGLFGKATGGARIAHVGLRDVSIVGNTNVGGLLGLGLTATIERSYVTGTVTGSDNVGGILGRDILPVSSVTLRNVWSSADVTATLPGTGSPGFGGGVVGGLSGFGGKIYDSYATGNVRGGNHVGGLIGYGQVTINNAYFSGTVGTYAGTSYSVAGILSYWLNPSLGAVTNAYWNTDTAGATGIGDAGSGTPTNLTGLTTAQMRDAANFTGFGFTGTPGGSGWVLVGSDGTLNGSNGAVLPMLASEWSPVIKNTHQLQLMAMNLGGSYTLANNLDAAATNAGANDVWLSSSFVPVGTSATRFTGSFDGQNRAIDALYIRTLAGGLFRDIGSGGTVRDLSITNADAAADFGGSAATLVRNNYGTVSNVFASGTLTGYNTVGGLVWKNFGLIDRSGTDIVIQAVSQGAGLAGWNQGTITNSYALGTVSAWGGIQDIGNINALSNAGLVSQNTGSISTSYASGLVAGGHEVSGLVAHNFPSGTISDSYSTATIIPYKSYGSNNYFGGIAAINEGTVSHVYYAGVWDRMNAAYSQGGSYAFITAEDPSHGGTCTGCVGVRKGYYYDYTVSTNEHFLEAQPAAGTLVIGGTPEATALWDKYRHADVFADAGFDISTSGGSSAVWRIYEGSTTPLLRTFLTPLTVTADSGSKTYDGTTTTSVGYSYSSAPDMSHILGTPTTSLMSRNTGSQHTSVTGMYSDQRGYDITFATGTYTVTKADLIISTSDVTKTYDGTTSAAGTAVATAGTSVMTGDSLNGGTFAYTDKNAGIGNKTVTVSGV